MKISAPRIEAVEGERRLVATVTWEDADRPPQDVYFSVAADRESWLRVDPAAFLVGSFVAAMHQRERRIHVDGPVDPFLVQGLDAAMRTLAQWYGDAWAPIPIEASDGPAAFSRPPTDRVTGLFLSAGVDSTAILIDNQQRLPPGHPHRVTEGIAVDWFVGLPTERREQLADRFPRLRANVERLAAAREIPVTSVATNLRLLFDDDSHVWTEQAHGSVLAAVGHALSHRLQRILISSTDDLRDLGPWGSHPLLDPRFSSTQLTVEHAGTHFTRLDKKRIVVTEPVALETLIVCTRRHRADSTGSVQNCGRCEKCMRAKTTLLALGVLDRSSAFNEHDVAAGELRKVEMTRPASVYRWIDLLEPLKEIGRQDLVDALNERIAAFRRNGPQGHGQGAGSGKAKGPKRRPPVTRLRRRISTIVGR